MANMKIFQKGEEIFSNPKHEYTKELLRAIPKPNPEGRDKRKKQRQASKSE